MWCHVCIIDFPSIEEFKYHIERYHSRMSSSESEESEHEIADVSERESDDVNTASNTFEGESYDSDHNIPAEKKSYDNDAYINTSPGFFQYDSDRSITTEIIYDKIAAAHTSQDKCYDYDFAENNSYEKTVALNESPSKIYVNDSKAHVSNTILGKRKLRERSQKKEEKKKKKERSHKKSNIKASGLKKSVRRRSKKVAFCEKDLPKKKLFASSHQKDIPEQSDNNETDHSESSFNEESNPQPVLNFVSPNSSNNSHPTSNNNPLLLIHPFAGQNGNNSAIIHSVCYEFRRTETFEVVNF